MSQDPKVSQDTNLTTSNSSASKKTIKRGRPSRKKAAKKVEAITEVPKEIKNEIIGGNDTTVSIIPEGVLQSIGQLDSCVTMARSKGVDAIAVTCDVLRALLMGKYNEDKYIIYHNVKLMDYRFMEESAILDNQDIHEKVFGNSKVSIGNGAMVDVGRVKGGQ